MAETAAQKVISKFERFREKLFEPVDIASIAIFRIMFGAVLLWEVYRFFAYNWIDYYYIAPQFHFKYYGFEWVQAWPGNGMYYHFAFVGLCAFCVMIGLFYRITSICLFLSFMYWFFLDQTRYLNHLYMTGLVAFLMMTIPAHRARSVDVLIWPKLKSDTVPSWCLLMLRLQVGLVYFFAGVAKLNGDWLRGEPLRQWLAQRYIIPGVGPIIATEPGVYFFSYGGLLFDLFIAPLLLWKRTRVIAFLMCVFFHVSNKILFHIGIFPMLMLGATTVMLSADWPRKICLLFAPLKDGLPKTLEYRVAPILQKTAVGFVIVYMSYQVFMPLRHWLYPGDVAWTEEGHRFSWRMKLRSKRGQIVFVATNLDTGKSWDLGHSQYLTREQLGEMPRWYDMVLQIAHLLRDELKERGIENVKITVRSKAALNGRELMPYISPDVDLAKLERSILPADWIIHSEAPLPEHTVYELVERYDKNRHKTIPLFEVSSDE